MNAEPRLAALAATVIVVATFAAALHSAEAAPGTCVISVGGKAIDPATHAIVVPEAPTPQEAFAAEDLRAHIEKLTGKAPAVVAESKLGDKTPIVVGKATAVLDKLGVKVDFDALGPDGIVLRTKGPALVLAGNKRGVLYAVYTFLEDYCGCRWFTPDCSRSPTSGEFKVADLDVRFVPVLENRATDYPCSRPPDWAVRNKVNGTQTQLDEKRGDKIDYSHFVHTFNSILDPAKDFAAHPEYFSEINGKRTSGNTQLCLTNPEVLRIAKETVRKWIAQSPKATIFSVSQNDWYNFCTCPACKALADKEGAQSGPLLHFVNAIADDIAKDFPDKLIDTLAYQYTRKPPLHVKPRPNVCVRLCSIECCFSHPLDVCPTNRTFVDDIVNWNKICNRLYIWDYVIDYSHSVMPFPNLYVLKPNIRFFMAHGVKGLYEEACYFTKGSELAELRTWIMAKTLWNPDYDTDKAIDEFLPAYFGPAAAGPIRKYIDLIHKQVRDHPDWHVNIWAPPTAPFLSAPVVAEAARLFDQAEAAVKDDPTFLHRVQVARLPVQYVQIMTASRGYQEKPDTLVPAPADDVSGIIDRFEAVAKKEGLSTVREDSGSGKLATWLEKVRQGGKPIPVVRLAAGNIELAVLPDVGGRIWRWTLKPGGKDILARPHDGTGADLPVSGGYEEYSQGEFHSPGWSEKYAVVKKDAASITLEATLKSGLRLTRTIELAADAPIVRIASKLTNAGKADAAACLRSHPQFAVADVRKAVVEIAQAAPAQPVRRPLDLPAGDIGHKDEFLSGQALPAGQWRLLDPAGGLEITNRFDPAQVAQVLLSWSIPDKRVNLELYTKQVTLKPGESIELKQEFEVKQTK